VPQQLSLSIKLNDDATFENFYVSGSDKGVETVRQQMIDVVDGSFSPERNPEPFIYLWGGDGSGVSHLLQASCHGASAQSLSAQYLPLTELLDYPPHQLLDNLEQLSLICLDDIQVVAGNSDWELALFDLYNRVRQTECRLLVGANCSVRELSLDLPDLQSRFGWGPVFHLPVPSDEEKKSILQFRAARRGMAMNEDVAGYLITRTARGLNELMCCLDRLEEASLQQRRKLSIPFVKQVFGF
jgi:DnaA family protein